MVISVSKIHVQPRSQHITTRLLLYVYNTLAIFGTWCYGWWFLFALGVYSCWYVLVSFLPGLKIILLAHTSTYYFLVFFFFFHLIHAHRPTTTHHPPWKGFVLTCIDSHWNVGGWWVMVGRRSEIGFALTWIASHWDVGGWWGVMVGRRLEIPLRRKWLHFSDPGESNSVLPFDFGRNTVWELHTSAAMPPTCVATPTKNMYAIESTTETTSTSQFFLQDILYICFSSVLSIWTIISHGR